MKPGGERNTRASGVGRALQLIFRAFGLRAAIRSDNGPPRDLAEWGRVSIDSYGLALVWENRFEVHIDQVIGLATRVARSRNAHATA